MILAGVVKLVDTPDLGSGSIRVQLSSPVHKKIEKISIKNE